MFQCWKSNLSSGVQVAQASQDAGQPAASSTAWQATNGLWVFDAASRLWANIWPDTLAVDARCDAAAPAEDTLAGLGSVGSSDVLQPSPVQCGAKVAGSAFDDSVTPCARCGT